LSGKVGLGEPVRSTTCRGSFPGFPLVEPARAGGFGFDHNTLHKFARTSYGKPPDFGTPFDTFRNIASIEAEEEPLYLVISVCSSPRVGLEHWLKTTETKSNSSCNPGTRLSMKSVLQSFTASTVSAKLSGSICSSAPSMVKNHIIGLPVVKMSTSRLTIPVASSLIAIIVSLLSVKQNARMGPTPKKSGKVSANHLTIPSSSWDTSSKTREPSVHGTTTKSLHRLSIFVTSSKSSL
jgi:hypothetical protein